MTVAQWVVLVVGAPLAVYLLVRVASAAFFKSKAEHDNQRGQHNVKR